MVENNVDGKLPKSRRGCMEGSAKKRKAYLRAKGMGPRERDTRATGGMSREGRHLRRRSRAKIGEKEGR